MSKTNDEIQNEIQNLEQEISRLINSHNPNWQAVDLREGQIAWLKKIAHAARLEKEQNQ